MERQKKSQKKCKFTNEKMDTTEKQEERNKTLSQKDLYKLAVENGVSFVSSDEKQVNACLETIQKYKKEMAERTGDNRDENTRLNQTRGLYTLARGLHRVLVTDDICCLSVSIGVPPSNKPDWKAVGRSYRSCSWKRLG